MQKIKAIVKRGGKMFFVIAVSVILAHCSGKKTDNTPVPPPPTVPTVEAELWMTTPSQSDLFKKQSAILPFGNSANGNVTITVDSTQKFQTVDGFGYTLTGGSAEALLTLAPAERTNILRELFAIDGNNIGVSYLRVSMGASDLSSSVFSYNDMPAGQTDPTLANFSLSKDTLNVIPVLKEILAINPSIKILATPWSPPVWMKVSPTPIGSSLQTQYYGAYANYFVKYVQAMKAKGITIDAVTMQNEPEHGNNEPSMLMTAAEQIAFVKNHLGPAFQAAAINTKIIAWDHNCDRADYALTVLSDAGAKQYLDGSAFHLYAGDISALGAVRNAHPDKNIYFTEQYTAINGDFGGDLRWHLKNVIIGSMRNWSKTALEWNLATDANYGPRTPKGCNSCKGALTIGTSVTKNVSYYIVAHASKFVRPGSVRIQTNNIDALQNVAFVTPDGKKVLIVENETNAGQSFNIRFKDKWIAASLPAGAVGTFVW